MDEKKLKEIWADMMQEAFHKFIDENIGWDDAKAQKPACFGSGDAMPWCSHCALRGSC